MAAEVTRIEEWAGDIQDRPGGLAEILKPLADAGADLECIVARRQPGKPGTGVVFVYPIEGAKVKAAAKKAGLTPVKDVWALRVSGPNKAGVGSQMLERLAVAGINMRGMNAVVIGNKYVCYCTFDNSADATKAARLLKG